MATTNSAVLTRLTALLSSTDSSTDKEPVELMATTNSAVLTRLTALLSSTDSSTDKEPVELRVIEGDGVIINRDTDLAGIPSDLPDNAPVAVTRRFDMARAAATIADAATTAADATRPYVETARDGAFDVASSAYQNVAPALASGVKTAKNIALCTVTVARDLASLLPDVSVTPMYNAYTLSDEDWVMLRTSSSAAASPSVSSGTSVESPRRVSQDAL